jgi:Family of unknown function (DUF5678)
MQMTLEEFHKRFPGHPEPAPMEYAGQWVAWSDDRTQIVAHGRDFGAVLDEARAAGCREPLMHKVIPAPFIG